MSDSKDQLYESLLDNLDDLVKVYRGLLDVVRREKEILVSAKLEDLTENNKSKDAMLLRIRNLENHRAARARELAAAVGADVENPRLLDIASHADSKFQDRLRNMHSVLELLVRRVSELNKSNEELVQAALNNITGAMNSIRETLKPKPVYGPKGKTADQKTEGGNLVSREA